MPLSHLCIELDPLSLLTIFKLPSQWVKYLLSSLLRVLNFSIEVWCPWSPLCFFLLLTRLQMYSSIFRHWVPYVSLTFQLFTGIRDTVINVFYEVSSCTLTFPERSTWFSTSLYDERQTGIYYCSFASQPRAMLSADSIARKQDLDLSYTCCYATIGALYVVGQAHHILSYSNAS